MSIVPETLNHNVLWFPADSTKSTQGHLLNNVRVVDNRYLVDSGALSGSYSNFTVYWDPEVSGPLPYKKDETGAIMMGKDGPIRHTWDKLQRVHWDDSVHINVLTVKRVVIHYLPDTFRSDSKEYPKIHHITLYCE